MAKKKQETAVGEESEISPSVPEDVAIGFDGITKVFNKALVANNKINLDIKKVRSTLCREKTKPKNPL